MFPSEQESWILLGQRGGKKDQKEERRRFIIVKRDWPQRDQRWPSSCVKLTSQQINVKGRKDNRDNLRWPWAEGQQWGEAGDEQEAPLPPQGNQARSRGGFLMPEAENPPVRGICLVQVESLICKPCFVHPPPLGFLISRVWPSLLWVFICFLRQSTCKSIPWSFLFKSILFGHESRSQCPGAAPVVPQFPGGDARVRSGLGTAVGIAGTLCLGKTRCFSHPSAISSAYGFCKLVFLVSAKQQELQDSVTPL